MADSTPNPPSAPSANPPPTEQRSIHEHCVTDRPAPSGQQPTGEIIKLNDVDTYIAKPQDYPQTPAKLLLLLTGGTGIHSTNNQLQADLFASEGFLVVMPDLFNGDAAPNADPAPAPATNPDDQPLLQQVQQRATELGQSFMLDMWLARQTEARAMPILYSVLDACKDEFADAVAHGGGVYAAGYCIGGRYVLLLASATQLPAWGWKEGAARPADEEAPAQSSGPLVKVGAVAHPASVALGDFDTVAAPLSLTCVEDDPLFPDEVRVAGEETLSKLNVEHEFEVYPGVPHGFAVVGQYEDQSIKNAQTVVYGRMLKWLKEH